MGQVNNLGTGDTFTADAKKYKIDSNALAKKVKAWYEAQANSPGEGKARINVDGYLYDVGFRYSKKSYNLTCVSVEKAKPGT